ncbi:lovastatin nonaketide synthase [Aspergillus udagawae]|nr:lovastatin nonaketide synthase [Aspergillus udagawae]
MTLEPIALVGTGCKFPGSSSSPSRLWNLLCNPKTVASEPPSTRFNGRSYYHPDGNHHGTTDTKESYFLSEDIRMFDASFFNISASEAEAIDPQQRLLLETVYESLERAGQQIDALRGSSTGVFCGVMMADWATRVEIDDQAYPRYTITGLARTNIANRISYFFDWHGPSLVVDTACSSSLVALHQAVTALRQGECSTAVVAGTNLLLHPNVFVSASKLQMLSPTGRGRMWDAKADGYARGEGIASIVLKRLSDAVADNDPIECVIRATCVNQDGRTTGLTMPSGKAQLDLIQSAYQMVDLDPEHRAEDRCQYFEAHGTGTPAGDPQEASAIYHAFFGNLQSQQHHGETEKLLKVPVQAMPWPALKPGVPRRVSVNSFGFGGTNAHAILESYEDSIDATDKPAQPSPKAPIPVVLPFVFSASSVRALATMLEQYIRYLEDNPMIDLVDLAWTLLQQRSFLVHRIALWAPTIDLLITRIREELDLIKTKRPSSIVSSQPHTDEKKSILGIFTGQGAQWPQMGLDLITHCPEARTWLDEMQTSLADLPVELRPSFSLQEELAVAQAHSKLHEAAISQPLCTALQIILINVLSVLGVSPAVVVGHSSGEIAAAYTIGFLSSADAIRIAYLRGHVAGLAEEGAMLAAGITQEEATVLCQQPGLDGKISLAAVNSPSSVTLSGDRDTISQVEQILLKEKKFARLLRVHTAYHSHHMASCAEAYLRALDAAEIQVRSHLSSRWFSSVYEAQEITLEQHGYCMTRVYWKDNMVNPVLFSPALQAALRSSGDDVPPDLVVEIGPHPALKGPVQQTITDLFPSEIPYVGLLNRSQDAIESFAKAIGQFWIHLGPSSIDIASFVALFDRSRKPPRIVQGLPTYPFEHNQPYWFETRALRDRLYARHQPHPLLGSFETNTTDGEWRWRQYLRREEIDWLDGHQIQSRTVFPATGYLIMALEAAAIIAASRVLCLVQVDDFSMTQAITFPDENETMGVETLFRVSDFRPQSGNKETGSFSCHATIGGRFTLCASGKLTLGWGEPEARLLPSRAPVGEDMRPVDINGFYQSLKRIGYGYSGPFQCITSLSRQLDASSGKLTNLASSLQFHPAVLDASLQMLLAALSTIRDGQLDNMLIPTGIDCVIFNPVFYGRHRDPVGREELLVDTVINSLGVKGCSGNVQLFTQNGDGVVQMEGVRVAPLEKTRQGRRPFSQVVWGSLVPEAKRLSYTSSAESVTQTLTIERIVLIHIKLISEQLTSADREGLDWHRARVVAWFDHVLSLTRRGKHPICPPEWLDSTQEDLDRLMSSLPPNLPAVFLGQVVASNMLRFLRGETTILEETRNGNLLGLFYKYDVETKTANYCLGDVVSQVVFRYPRMKILEIGAGTGSATSATLARIGRSYHSYTFTDISVGFFEDAQQQFAEHGDHFLYQSLDITQDPTQQGFEDASYDLVIASNVLHATPSIRQTLNNVRRLLKPGGYLVLMEATNTDTLGVSFCFGGFEGWWVGEKDGRMWGPRLSVSEWDEALQDTGFGGLDSVSELADPRLSTYSVLLSQAVDDRMRLLRAPLSVPDTEVTDTLVIIGGAENHTSRLVNDISVLLGSNFSRVIQVQTLEALGDNDLHGLAVSALVLTDVDKPCFEDLSEDRLKGLQYTVGIARKLLWVTAGSESDCPWFCMSKGWLKCLPYEHKDGLYQYLNVVEPADLDAVVVARTLMRLVYTDQPNHYTLPGRVWVAEPELRLEKGAMTIPRLADAPELNTRYEACRQAVYHSVQLEDASVKLVPSDSTGQHELHMDNERSDGPKTLAATQACIRLHIQCSSAQAVRVGGGRVFLHLVIGIETNSNKRMLAFADRNATVVTTPSSWCRELPAEVSENEDQTLLHAVVTAIVAYSIVQQAEDSTVVWVHEADEALQQAIEMHAVTKGIRCQFTTADLSSQRENTVIVHPRSSTRALVNLISPELSMFISLDSEDGNDGFSRGISQLLPYHVLRGTMSSVYGVVAVPPVHENQMPYHLLTDTLTMVTQLMQSARLTSLPVVNIKQFSAIGLEAKQGLIIDWTRYDVSNPLSVRIEAASSMIDLSKDKTYLLAGMTGDLGRSVCRWMITRGARNVILTSRSPNVSSRWLEAMAALGANVVPMKMDLSNRDSIASVYRHIQQHHPPLGGIVNGALVLHDAPFVSVSLEMMQSTFAAKVLGSLVLDELSCGTDLDFFILCGSLAGVIGNWNQSAYSAANGFQAGLIRRRRMQNRVGSIVQPGVISGVGYIARKGAELAEYLRNSLGAEELSERDLHELFAEAILAGHPSSNRNAEIVAGAPVTDPVKQPDIIWYHSPFTWHRINYHIQSRSDVATTQGESQSMRMCLETVTSMEEAAEVVTEGFSRKLRNKFNLPSDAALPPHTRLTDLGIDSLVAVDLRRWFQKELLVEMPTMQILSGESIATLAAAAVSMLPPGLIPIASSVDDLQRSGS